MWCRCNWQDSWRMSLNKELHWTMAWASLPLVWVTLPFNWSGEKSWNNSVHHRWTHSRKAIVFQLKRGREGGRGWVSARKRPSRQRGGGWGWGRNQVLLREEGSWGGGGVSSTRCAKIFTPLSRISFSFCDDEDKMLRQQPFKQHRLFHCVSGCRSAVAGCFRD